MLWAIRFRNLLIASCSNTRAAYRESRVQNTASTRYFHPACSLIFDPLIRDSIGNAQLPSAHLSQEGAVNRIVLRWQLAGTAQFTTCFQRGGLYENEKIGCHRVPGAVLSSDCRIFTVAA